MNAGFTKKNVQNWSSSQQWLADIIQVTYIQDTEPTVGGVTWEGPVENADENWLFCDFTTTNILFKK